MDFLKVFTVFILILIRPTLRQNNCFNFTAPSVKQTIPVFVHCRATSVLYNFNTIIILSCTFNPKDAFFNVLKQSFKLHSYNTFVQNKCFMFKTNIKHVRVNWFCPEKLNTNTYIISLFVKRTDYFWIPRNF